MLAQKDKRNTVILIILAATFALWFISIYMIYQEEGYNEMLFAWIGIFSILVTLFVPVKKVQIVSLVFNIIFSLIWYFECFAESYYYKWWDIGLCLFALLMYLLALAEVIVKSFVGVDKIFDRITTRNLYKGGGQSRVYNTTPNTNNLEEELKRLKVLFDEDLISKDEYDELKRKALHLDVQSADGSPKAKATKENVVPNEPDKSKKAKSFLEGADISFASDGLISIQTPPKSSSTVTIDENGNKRIHTKRPLVSSGIPETYHRSDRFIDLEEASLNRNVKDRESYCYKILENQEYILYNYNCYSDKSGGISLIQRKDDKSDIRFMGKAKKFSLLFHDYLIGIDSNAYASELYFYARNCSDGTEKVYQWFGKYSIPYKTGARYTQDTITGMYIDSNDSIIITGRREKCKYVNNSVEEDVLCNIDTDYVVTVSLIDNDFSASVVYSNNGVIQVFENEAPE